MLSESRVGLPLSGYHPRGACSGVTPLHSLTLGVPKSVTELHGHGGGGGGHTAPPGPGLTPAGMGARPGDEAGVWGGEAVKALLLAGAGPGRGWGVAAMAPPTVL